MSHQRKWPHDLRDLQDFAKNEIMPAWEGCEPHRDYPSIRWLRDNGFSHLRWVLSEKHNITVRQFFYLFVGSRSPNNNWNVTDPITIKHAEDYLRRKERNREWRKSTTKNKYYLLNRVFDEYHQETGSDDLISIANDESRATDAYNAFTDVIYNIRSDSSSDRSAYKYLREIQNFYEALLRQSRIEYNPTKSLEKEFRWEWSTDGSTPLTPSQIGQLWAACDTLEDYIIIIGYVIWGIRRKELPLLHQSQFDWSADPITIEFAEKDRKTGAGTVTILFGAKYIKQQFDRLSTQSVWNGHLLPQEDDLSRPRTSGQCAYRFKKLCKDAGVKVDGKCPTPNNGRSTWHEFQADAGVLLYEITEQYSSLQDYTDVDSAMGYQSEKPKEHLRQVLFLKRLESVLPPEAYNSDIGYLSGVKSQYDLDEFK